MRKRIITVTLFAVMLCAAALGFSACGEKKGVAWHGIVGAESHSYFPYAKVTVDKDGTLKEVVMGEAFGPTGKLYNNNGTVQYRNAWYDVGGEGNAQTNIATLNTAVNEAAAADKATVLGNHYISIAGEVFKLESKELTPSNNGTKGNNLVFVSTKKADKILSDNYLAENIKWYVEAIEAGKVFACNDKGKKLADWTPADGALLKNDENSTYQATNENRILLSGKYFKKAFEIMEDYAMEKKLVLETETIGTGTRLYLKGIDWSALETMATADGKATTTITSKTYMQYQVEYYNVAIEAFNKAKATWK